MCGRPLESYKWKHINGRIEMEAAGRGAACRCPGSNPSPLSGFQYDMAAAVISWFSYFCKYQEKHFFRKNS